MVTEIEELKAALADGYEVWSKGDAFDTDEGTTFTCVNYEFSHASRWNGYYDIVLESDRTGRFYRLMEEQGLTEYQDGEGYLLDTLVEVFAKDKTITVWVSDADR